MEELTRVWGSNIENGRRALGMSQAELADAVGVWQSSVAKWESGDNIPRDRHKVRIAQALRQDVRTLFPLIAGAA